MDLIEFICRLASFRTHAELASYRLTADVQRSLALTALREGVAAWVVRRIDDSYADASPSLLGVAAILRNAPVATAAANARNTALLVRIEKLLAQHDIEVAALKGVAMQVGYYPDQSLRPIGDLDLYVDPDNIYRARDILLADGAVNSNPDQPPVVDMLHAHLAELSYGGQKVELHHHLYSPESDMELPCAFRTACDFRAGHLMLAPRPMFYHLATHTHRHYCSTGYWRVGWLLDLAVLLEGEPDPVGMAAYALTANARGSEGVMWSLQRVLPLLSEQKAEMLQSKLPALLQSYSQSNPQTDIQSCLQTLSQTLAQGGGLAPQTMGEADKEHRPQTVWQFKRSALLDKLRHARLRLAQQDGWRARWKELKRMAAHEHRRTLDAFPQKSALGAWCCRVFGSGISARGFKTQKPTGKKPAGKKPGKN